MICEFEVDIGLSIPFGVIASEFRRVASLLCFPPENKLSAPNALVEEFLAVKYPVFEVAGGMYAVVRLRLCAPDAAVYTL